MLFFSNIKVNLGLQILNKREDGFHNISSIFYPVPFGDAMEFVVGDQRGRIELGMSGINIPGATSDNLITKAYYLLHDKFDLPSIRAHILKRIPPGTGVGGGSSNGSWMLRSLNEYFDLKLSTEELKELALELGSDCAYFVYNGPRLIGGRGELIHYTALDLSGNYIVLLYPNVHISTIESYQNLEIPVKERFDLSVLAKTNKTDWKNLVENDFEPYAFERYPVINDLKEKLYEKGAYYASMSGTGSVVYGLFEESPVLDDLDNQLILWKGEL